MPYRRAAIVLAAIGLIVGLGPLGQGVDRATCLDCHEQEGMTYAVVQETPFLEIPQGEEQTFEVKVSVPWLHEITSTLVTVNLTQAPGLQFETPDPLHRNETVELGPTGGQDLPVEQAPSEQNVTFPVQAGATGVVVSMTQSEDTSGMGLNDVDTTLYFPDNSSKRAKPDGLPAEDVGGTQPPRDASQAQTTEQIVVTDEAKLVQQGTWNYQVERVAGEPQTPGTGEPVTVTIDVYYNSTRLFSKSSSKVIGQGETVTLSFPIKGREAGNQTVSYEATSTHYYLHAEGTPGQDEGNYTIEGERSFEVGDELRTADTGPAVPQQPPINWKLNARAWGEATGFIGLFMIPLSLILGGAFGRRNVLWVNKIATSARLRVLWHNALSFVLLAISLIHLVLFLYEPVYNWGVGMVWGGLGTLALIGLGITGGFQRRFARSIGYANWRFLHIALAVIFVASVLVHVLVDGVHFDFLRSWLGLN